MITFTYTISHPVGLYAKIADGLVTIATRYEADVFLEYSQKKVNLKSLMGVISLGVPCNGKVNFYIEGSEAKEVKMAIDSFLRDIDPFFLLPIYVTFLIIMGKVGIVWKFI